MRITTHRKWIAAALLGCCSFTGAARADDVYVRGTRGAPDLKLANISVRTVKDGELIYSISTRETKRPVIDVGRLELTGETAFNAADKAFSDARASKDPAAAKAKYAEAVSGYTTTLSGTNKPWLKDYVLIRMQTAAPMSGRFDIALNAWKVRVDQDPVTASKSRPPVADIEPKSQYLADAAKLLQTWSQGASKPEARKAFLEMLAEVQTQMGDAAGAQKTQIIIIETFGTPEDVAAIGPQIAMTDLAAKKYDAALERISKINPALLTDAGRADVAFITAEVKSSKLAATAPADDWKDLAIEYMKVVAGAPSSANAGSALVKVGQIHETLKEPETAVKIYQKVVADHANTPAAAAAQAALARLGKSARG